MVILVFFGAIAGSNLGFASFAKHLAYLKDVTFPTYRWLWWFQTMIFGIRSVKNIINYDPVKISGSIRLEECQVCCHFDLTMQLAITMILKQAIENVMKTSHFSKDILEKRKNLVSRENLRSAIFVLNRHR